MSACAKCGQTWLRDPALEVPCPVCLAKAGAPCQRPSGHQVPGGIHLERDRAALQAGIMPPCPGRPMQSRVLPGMFDQGGPL